MSKRSHKGTDFAKIEQVTSPSGNTKIHRVIISLSPIKTKRTTGYFDREKTDGKIKMRLYGFDSANGVRRKLLDFNGTEKAVALFSVKSNPPEMAILLRSRLTNVIGSEKRGIFAQIIDFLFRVFC